MSNYDRPQIVRDLDVSEDMNQDFLELPGIYFHYGAMLEDEEHKLRSLKTRLEVYEETQKEIIRATLENEEERATEARVKSLLKLKKKWQRLKKKINIAKHNVGILTRACKSFEFKQSSLINVGASLRKIEPDLTIFDEPKHRKKKKKKKRK